LGCLEGGESFISSGLPGRDPLRRQLFLVVRNESLTNLPQSMDGKEESGVRLPLDAAAPLNVSSARFGPDSVQCSTIHRLGLGYPRLTGGLCRTQGGPQLPPADKQGGGDSNERRSCRRQRAHSL
jgi:hypothetical protein